MPHAINLPVISWTCPECGHENSSGFYASCEECDIEIEIGSPKPSQKNFSFFLPTEDEWYGTYKGGYVKVHISNGLSPEFNQVRIGFWGNDDMALIRDSEVMSVYKADAYMYESLMWVLNLPRPISKDYLRSQGFEAF